MRDYSNMPTLKWDGQACIQRARAQILRQEPVILMLPTDTDLHVDPDVVHCELDETTGIAFNCAPHTTLDTLAQRSRLMELMVLSEAAVQSGSTVDVDAEGHRLIFHD